ncbi:MAG: 3-hydroxyacyl-CoA dehydrogenase/enoyl-CoA hydratase family protein [Alicyclobacillus sp.]|nr:3-hydroxyacyl-CoA dehydrogenase/enoyl-CoA hydratase family protein [Alicyclobacillus sp.]
MGAAVAAHLANAGLTVLLLDRLPDELTEQERQRGWSLSHPAVRNRLARRGLEQAAQAKPAAFFSERLQARIATGNLADDLPRLAECDWVLEAIVEDLAAKRALFAQVEEVVKPDALVTTNTSGLSLAALAEGRSAAFRRRFFGTHFFNPPRYMKLLELIPGPDTDPVWLERFRAFAERVLGKGVVVAKDTPNFIANRIGTYGLLATLAAMEAFPWGVDEVDALTGPVLGRPRSATFRTLDMVGLDTFLHVAQNVRQQVRDPAEQAALTPPPVLVEMVKRGWLGEKAGQGFYRRTTDANGERLVEVLDLATLTYRPRRPLRSPVWEAARRLPSAAERLRALVHAEEPAGRFAWTVLKRTLLYTAAHQWEVADDLLAVDQAMKWGFNWELGPYEVWDALGLPATLARMREEGEVIPDWVAAWVDRGHTSFYKREDGERLQVYVLPGEYRTVAEPPHVISLARLKEQGRLVRGNASASLIDLGDGVWCLELHPPKQALGPDAVQMLALAADEVERQADALVLASAGAHFCVGANLMLMLLEAQDENWDAIDAAVRQLQQVTMRIKYLSKPVVAAPCGYTLGGGAEICFPAARVQAAAETYMGLVETGVGLIPAGGGCKEMLLRACAAVHDLPDVRLDAWVRRVFETVALAKVGSSALHAQELGYLRSYDGMTMHRDHLLYDAKQVALGLVRAGYRPPQPELIPVAGEPTAALLQAGVYGLQVAGHISEHDARIARQLIRVLTGGALPRPARVSEQYLLDLEREAFLSLIGEPKTQQRMQHMLATGKPLRN